MPFSLHINHHPYPTSWNLLGTNPTTKESIPSHQNLFLRRVSAFSSLRASLDCVSDGGGAEKGSQQQPTSPIRLPFVVRSPTKVSRFFWNGSSLQLVTVDGGGAASDDDGLFRVCGSLVRDFFIPRQVRGNYMDYVKWKLLHRVFSSALQVLATQVGTWQIVYVC